MAETEPTLYFPFAVYPIVGSYTRETITDTDIEVAYYGSEQRLARYPIPGYQRFKLTTIPIRPEIYTRQPPENSPIGSGSKLKDLMYFLELCRGRANNFWFVPPDFEYFQAVSLGTLAGAESATGVEYRLPDQDVKESSSSGISGTGFAELKVAGTPQVYGIDYVAFNGSGYYTDLTWNNGSIASSITTIQWLGGGAPAGEMIASFFGTKRLICRLDSDVMPRKIFAPGVSPYYLQFDIAIREVR